MEILKIFLIPIALIYGLVVSIRNRLFKWRILPSETFPLPVVSVGNLSVGGTGKTPHIEYLIRLLSAHHDVNTLSRGYGRKTRGFKQATISDYASTIGDEPLQYFRKFNNIDVFVDEKRRRGIRKILNLKNNAEVILLDDAFQHRYVKPGLSILLTDFHQLYSRDYLLPAGKLREPIRGAQRADIIIVTKTDSVLSPIIARQLIDELKPAPHQQVYFSFIKYGEFTSLWDNDVLLSEAKHFSAILLFAGIANTYPIEDHLRKYCNELIVIRFQDHYQYTDEDLIRIKQNFDDLYSQNKLLVTTEKDAMRLLQPELVENAVKLPVFYLPIEVEIHKDYKQQFDEQILNYVNKD
ncbi:MAG: tetraacyldisaccharide 4'-kinase [Lentimicrobium sp.]|jgi:tetraacyldisaccharide 4'-kinase|nr:tetraacyldisaccharide 4'-kinase [Lentimicrobium sp.]